MVNDLPKNNQFTPPTPLRQPNLLRTHQDADCYCAAQLNSEVENPATEPLEQIGPPRVPTCFGIFTSAPRTTCDSIGNLQLPFASRRHKVVGASSYQLLKLSSGCWSHQVGAKTCRFLVQVFKEHYDMLRTLRLPLYTKICCYVYISKSAPDLCIYQT